MNETITLNMENLTATEREQMMNLVKKANKPDKVWKPNVGDEYKVLDSFGSVGFSIWNNDRKDDEAHLIGNCFKSKENAMFARERLKVITELERFAEKHNDSIIDWNDGETDKYCIYYESNINTIGIDYNTVCRYNDIYFTSKEIARAAIDSIGENRLKKYYFCVED